MTRSRLHSSLLLALGLTLTELACVLPVSIGVALAFTVVIYVARCVNVYCHHTDVVVLKLSSLKV